MVGWNAILEDEEDDEMNAQLFMGLNGEEEFIRPRIHKGSRLGRAPNVDRDRQAMHSRMVSDYFSTTMCMVHVTFVVIGICTFSTHFLGSLAQIMIETYWIGHLPFTICSQAVLVTINL